MHKEKQRPCIFCILSSSISPIRAETINYSIISCVRFSCCGCTSIISPLLHCTWWILYKKNTFLTSFNSMHRLFVPYTETVLSLFLLLSPSLPLNPLSPWTRTCGYVWVVYKQDVLSLVIWLLLAFICVVNLFFCCFLASLTDGRTGFDELNSLT